MATAQTPLADNAKTVINHHPNVWEDHFLQSLSSPFSEGCYGEKLRGLVEEIKEKAFIPLLLRDDQGEGEGICMGIVQRFFIVDALHRLGIHRYFENEIKSYMDYTYKDWNENGVSSWMCTRNSSAHLNTTALGFRVLRLNAYHVSQDVFRNFCDGDGEFAVRSPTPTGEIGDENEVRSVLSLYTAAEICFPGETLMRKAKSFASRYLHQTLENSQSVTEKSQLLMEVEYYMKNSWRARNPRWEAWNCIRIFRKDIDSWMSIQGVYRIPNDISRIILEAAILDFNILQAQHQIELKILSTWWNQTCVKELHFFRHRHVEYYLAYACALYESEFCATRIGYGKFGVMCTVIDDMFDTHGTIDNLVHFKTALLSWDVSEMANLPEDMQLSYKFLEENYMELVDGAEKIHGPHARKWFQDYWTRLILSQWQDAQWHADEKLPTLNQYLKNALDSSYVPVVTLYPMLLIDTSLPNDILERITKFEYDAAMGCRLIDDYQDFLVKKGGEDIASWLECYIADNPGTKREQTLEYANITMQLHTEEITRDFLFYEKDIPTCCKRVYFDGMYKWVAFMWRDIDGFSYSSKGTKDDIMKILINPITIYP